ncbi:YciI family protein [Pseudonocardia sp. GCM10023141]|uniref:YciI family protein n=1 Tax=Pseudonocardia sp. GCM10023141 TaxID=3252653 RepID=UPI003610EFCB
MSAADPGHPVTPDGEEQSVVFLCLSQLNGADAGELSKHMAEHRQWLAALERQGRLFAAGPLLDDDHRSFGSGVLVVRAASRDEAGHLLDQDPFHVRGLRTYRLHPWRINEGVLRAIVTLSDGTADLT